MLGVNNCDFCFRIKTFAIWIKSVSRWLTEWKYFCVGLLVVVLPWIEIRYGVDEATIRVTGMVLQLLGIGTVAWNINKTRKEFRHPGILKIWYQRLRHFPLFGKQIEPMILNGVLPAITGEFYAYESINAGHEATDGERIQALEKNLQIAHDRISQMQNEYNQRFHKYCEKLELEKRVQKQEIEKIHKKIETTETGGLSILGMGVVLLCQGVIMSTIPTELAKWLG